MKKLIFLSAVFLSAVLLFPQTSNTSSEDNFPKENLSESSASKDTISKKKNSGDREKRTLPSSFHKINLGMDIEDVKTELKKDSDFAYRGEPDLSLLPTENRSLIESAGIFFIRRGWFQFYKDKLYSIIVGMNTENMDYYSIYTKLTEKYGEPDFIDPKKAFWEDDSVRLVLERPLTVKYIDITVFKELLEKSSAQKAFTTTLRENFINEF